MRYWPRSRYRSTVDTRPQWNSCRREWPNEAAAVLPVRFTVCWLDEPPGPLSVKTTDPVGVDPAGAETVAVTELPPRG